ncbi:erv26 super protein [Xylographa carneopallida]|nr:erv26 super protein [Xylographa carneopallida]
MASGGLLWGHTFFSATAFTPLHPEIWTNSARSSHDHSITSRPPPHHAHRLTSTRLLAMWILPLIGYIGIALGFCFLTLAIASGLYYLSELVEEHTVAAKKLLTRLIYSVIALQGLLVAVDGFPVGLSLLSIGSHAVYLQNLRFFPTVRLADPVFVLSCGACSLVLLRPRYPVLRTHLRLSRASCLGADGFQCGTVLVLLNHYLWFRHFSSPTSFPPTSSSTTTPYHSPPPSSALPSFTEVASYFFLLIWLVPFALFVSLSASENVLPSMGSEYATDPASPLSPAGVVSSSLGAGMSSAGETMASVGAMLSPRSLSRGLARSRSRSQMRGGSLGYEDRGRRRKGGGSLVRVAVDGVRGWVGDLGRLLGWGEGRGRF